MYGHSPVDLTLALSEKGHFKGTLPHGRRGTTGIMGWVLASFRLRANEVLGLFFTRKFVFFLSFYFL